MIKRRTVILVLLLTCMPLLARAHEGMIHVIGVVTALTDKSIAVQTTDNKSVAVVLADTTSYEKSKKAATHADLRVGDRIVIHAMKMNGVLQAHTVEFSEAGH